MFALWYGALIYKEYRDTIWNKFTKKQSTKETAIISPSRIPIIDPKLNRTPSPQPPRSPEAPSSPMPPPVATSTPLSTPERRKIVESVKPLEIPRPPSPYPMAAEDFEELVPNNEDVAEERTDDEEEEEEEDENSVISSSGIYPARGER